MRDYQSYRENKRSYWLELWEKLSSEMDSEGASEAERVDLYLDIASKMAAEGVYEPRKYDSLQLLDAALISRDQLFSLMQSSTFKSPEDEAHATEVHNVWMAELLSFLVEVHLIVSAKTRSQYGDEDKDIRQELYNLFEHKDSYARQESHEDKLQIMIRLIMLSVPSTDWVERKNWAYRNFTRQGVWPESRKAERWKELRQYWEKFGDVVADGDFDSLDEEIETFWEFLLVRKRSDSVPRGRKNRTNRSG